MQEVASRPRPRGDTPTPLPASPLPRWRSRWAPLIEWSTSPVGTAVLLVALTGLSLAVRWEGRNVWLWVDETLTAGISNHKALDIPSLLRQDGSPPLYYELAHFWIRAFGDSEQSLHTLSLVFAVACVPAAYWAGKSLLGRRVGWFVAVLAAANPFLTYYGREARMYSLVAFLALLCTACYLHAFAFGRRRYLPAFAVLLAALLYTHNWALFFIVGAVAGLVPCLVIRHDDRRNVLRDALLGFGAAGLLFLPWVPTLLYQVRHTGAPWSMIPRLREIVSELDAVVGDERVLVILLLVGGAGVVAMIQRHRNRELAAVVALLAVAFIPLGLSWLTSQFEPNWATRYFAMIVGAVLIAAGLGLARAGWQGVAAAALILLFWTHPLGRITGDRPPIPLAQKSNVKAVAATVAPLLRPDVVVVSTHAEQTPALHYYLPKVTNFYTPMGRSPDPSIFDWRDALARMRAGTVDRVLKPLVDRMAVGQQLLFVGPTGTLSGERDPEWFKVFYGRTDEYQQALTTDHRLRLETTVGTKGTNTVQGVSAYALLFQKIAP